MNLEDSTSELNKKVNEWLEWDKNPVTKKEIEELVNANNVDRLTGLLGKRMEFGTAGLRASMGAGFSQMNDLTIVQTMQGFVEYMLEICPNLPERGVIIGYDARYNSRRFAELCTAILVNKGVRVYLFSKICPTPYVAYGVKKLSCDWGIMVTASHNPKEDNGYKVYFGNGAQIISPHDKRISESILKNLVPLDSSWNTDIIKNSPLVTDPLNYLHSEYMKDLKSLSNYFDVNKSSPVKFTYTPMHGVGYWFVEEAFKAFNFSPFIGVKEQAIPDPEFPTVKFPNPEEGKSALNLAVETAERNDSKVILANDPDADRLAMAEKQPDGKWRILSGNEIGALLGYWILECHKKKTQSLEDVYCIASTVSSKILRSISEKEGLRFVETLTGFKWMGNRADELQKQGKTVIFAFEEAIGFMCGTNVLDKDGVSAAVIAAEMISQLNEKGLSLIDQLEMIYKKYGYHLSQSSYFLCYDQEVIKNIFERLRNYGGPGKYPEMCGSYKIKYIRDLTTGYDNSQPDLKAILPSSKSSQMITFTFENNCIVTMRTSGTEPKIKYYCELISDQNKEYNNEEHKTELEDIVSAITDNFFQPKHNNLTYRSP